MNRRSMLGLLGGGASLYGNWSSFRGGGSSVTAAKNLPLEWGEGKHIAWSVGLPGHGQSAPVLWKNDVFVSAVSGAQKQNLHLMSFDAATGAGRWSTEQAAGQLIEDGPMVTKAAPTPVADPDRVFFLFDSGDVLGCRHDGAMMWKRRLTKDYGELHGPHGLGASLRLAQDHVLVYVVQKDLSYLIALDPEKGTTDWITERPATGGACWSTPVVAKLGGLETVIVSGIGTLEAYSATHGQLLWRKDGFPGNTVCSPTLAEHPKTGEPLLILGSADKGVSCALKLYAGPREPEVLWRAANATAYFASPLAHDGCAYFVNKVGALHCLDLATGAEHWNTRLSGEHWAAPMGAGDRVYFFGTEGVTTVFASGPKPKKLAENALPPDAGRVYGVAPLDGGLIFRTPARLIRVSTPAAAKPKYEWKPVG